MCAASEVCSAATGFRCVPATPASCPATGCGPNATCRSDGVCACSGGFVSCNGDLGQADSDGCECQGGCNGTLCAGAAGCSPTIAHACGSATQHCEGNACVACPPGSFNCDGLGGCEKTGTPCGVTSSCTASQPMACGTDQYCNASGVCTTCPAGKLNCDGVDQCEADPPCDAPPPPPAGCDATCVDAMATYCVRNPARGNICEECLTDAHCTGNPRSHGPRCNTTDLAGTGANWCVCASDAECATTTMGKRCLPTPTAVPKPAFKQCTCQTDADCNAPYTICEGGSSGFGRCQMPCRADDPATAGTNEDTCYWAGMLGECDVSTGRCTFTKH